LTECRLFQRKAYYGRLDGFIDAILDVGLLAIGVDERVHAASLHGRLIAIESVTGKAHHLAGAGHVAKFGGQIQQADLVFNDVLRNTTHGVTPLR